MNRKLEQHEKEEILKAHIPYKLIQLRHHSKYKKILKNKLYKGLDDLYREHEICAIEIAFISGRLFLEFFGLVFNNKSQTISEREKGFREDDLLITDFDCPTIKLTDLSQKQKNILTIFLIRANKGSGHFTWQKRDLDGWEVLDEASAIIEDLLKVHLYDKLGIEFPG